MGQLIPFFTDAEDAEAPPDGSIEGAAWLAKVLRQELHGVLADPGLTTAERRAEVVKFAKVITQATPNHEIYEARKQLRDEEGEAKESSLRGTVTTSAKTSRAGHLRADAPRKRK